MIAGRERADEEDGEAFMRRANCACDRPAAVRASIGVRVRSASARLSAPARVAIP
jgi:hypothetical protein